MKLFRTDRYPHWGYELAGELFSVAIFCGGIAFMAWLFGERIPAWGYGVIALIALVQWGQHR